MKIFRMVCLTLLAGIADLAYGQNYQMPYHGNFNSWAIANGKGDDIPKGWHSFSGADCKLWVGCGIARNNHSSRVTGRTGAAGDYACKIYAKSVLGVVANGALTTGRMHIGSTTATDESNYIYSDRDGSGRYPFAGRPDSIYLYAKFNMAKTETATLKIHLHNNTDFIDYAGNSTGGGTRLGGSICAFSGQKTAWKLYKFPFTYACATSPNYMLASFSTNAKTGGGTNGDALYIDDVTLIYNKHLSDLRLDGVTIDGFDRNTLTYIIPYRAGETFPTVTAVPESDLIRSCSIIQATVSCPTATVTITHNDYSILTYTILFQDIDPLPMAANPSVAQPKSDE